MVFDIQDSSQHCHDNVCEPFLIEYIYYLNVYNIFWIPMYANKGKIPCFQQGLGTMYKVPPLFLCLFTILVISDISVLVEIYRCWLHFEVEQTFLCPQGSSGRSNNQTAMRQISIENNQIWHIHMYGNPASMRESETPHSGEVQR